MQAYYIIFGSFSYWDYTIWPIYDFWKHLPTSIHIHQSCLHSAKPRADRHYEQKSDGQVLRAVVQYLIWPHIYCSGLQFTVHRINSKGKLWREMSWKLHYVLVAMKLGCLTPWKVTVIYEEWFSFLMFIGPSTAEYKPSLIMDFTAWVYLYRFGRLQWLLHFHFIMINYLKSFLPEQIPPALAPARMFHFVLKIAVENFLEPLICQNRVYYHSQSQRIGAVWKVL